MTKSKFSNRIYHIINVFSILIALFFAVSLIAQNLDAIMNLESYWLFVVALLLFICTHFVKLLRLYLIMIEMGIRFDHFIAFYIKTTFINIMLPYKSGEVFRIYFLAKKVNDVKAALLGIATERVFDAGILLLIIVPSKLITGYAISSIDIILLIFLVVVITSYSIFPSLYTYFNNHWFFNRLSKRSNRMLALLESLNKLYLIQKGLIHKRAFTIGIITIISWFMDFGVLYILANLTAKSSSIEVLIDFINDAFSLSGANHLAYYIVLASVCFLGFSIYKLTKLMLKGRLPANE